MAPAGRRPLSAAHAPHRPQRKRRWCPSASGSAGRQPGGDFRGGAGARGALAGARVLCAFLCVAGSDRPPQSTLRGVWLQSTRRGSQSSQRSASVAEDAVEKVNVDGSTNRKSPE